MKVYVKPGNIVRSLTIGHSEVAMHMRVAGTQMDVLVVPSGAWGAMAQLLRPDGSEFSFPITLGEAGLYQDSGGIYFNTEQNPGAYVESRGRKPVVKTEQSIEAVTGSLMDTFGAAWDALSVDEKVALAEDVYAMARDEDMISVDAVKEFVRRIGGTQNLMGYLRTIMAGLGRREHRAFESQSRTLAQKMRGFMEAHAKAQARQQGYRIEYLSAGTRVWVKPTGSGVRDSYPAANWITNAKQVTLLEDAPNEGTLDVIDVRLDDGSEESIYDFNIECAVDVFLNLAAVRVQQRESLKHEEFEVGDTVKFHGTPVEVVAVGVEGGEKVRVKFPDGHTGNVFPDALTEDLKHEQDFDGRDPLAAAAARGEIVGKTKEDLEAAIVPLGGRVWSDETYGPKSMIYVNWGSPEGRASGEIALRRQGFVIHSYDVPEISEIQVDWFPGRHWDEQRLKHEGEPWGGPEYWDWESFERWLIDQVFDWAKAGMSPDEIYRKVKTEPAPIGPGVLGDLIDDSGLRDIILMQSGEEVTV